MKGSGSGIRAGRLKFHIGYTRKCIVTSFIENMDGFLLVFVDYNAQRIAI